jgi:hypothetical protein
VHQAGHYAESACECIRIVRFILKVPGCLALKVRHLSETSVIICRHVATSQSVLVFRDCKFTFAFSRCLQCKMEDYDFGLKDEQNMLCSSFKMFPEFADIIYRNYLMWEISVQRHSLWSYGCVQKEAPRKMKKQHLFSPSRQCSSTPVGFDQGFLNKEQCDKEQCGNTGTFSILSWPVRAEFYLFLGFNQRWSDGDFVVLPDTTKNVTDVLQTLSQNGFQECFHHLYSRWQKCTVAQRELFWRKRGLRNCSAFCISFTVGCSLRSDIMHRWLDHLHPRDVWLLRNVGTFYDTARC